MQEELIQNLREALKLSPQNIPLRLTLAEALLNSNLLQEAEAEYKIVLEAEPQNIQAKSGLAKIYFAQQKYSTAIVILEDLIELKPNDVSLLMLLSRSLLRNEERNKAMDYYKQALQLNPSLLDEELDQHLGRLPRDAAIGPLLGDQVVVAADQRDRLAGLGTPGRWRERPLELAVDGPGNGGRRHRVEGNRVVPGVEAQLLLRSFGGCRRHPVALRQVGKPVLSFCPLLQAAPSSLAA